MSSVAKLRIRTKLSQLLAGVVIAPLLSFVPAALSPSVLPSAQAAQTLSCSRTSNATATTQATSDSAQTFTLSVGSAINKGEAYKCAGIATIPSGVTTLEFGAFVPWDSNNSPLRNPYLTSFVIPASLTTMNIGFINVSGVQNLTIPSTITSISSQSFQGMTALTTATIEGPANSANTLTLPFASFNEDKLALTIGNGYVNFGGTFGLGAKFTSVTLGPNVRIIGDYAFSGQTDTQSFTNLTFPSGLTTIGTEAFKNNPYLKNISFGSTTPGLTSIAASAFASPTVLETVQYCGLINPSYSNSTLNSYLFANLPSTASIYCQSGSAPTVSNVGPASGTPSGGQTVTIQGTNLTDAKVYFEGANLAVTNNTASSLQFVTPSGSVGTKKILVVTNTGSVTKTFTIENISNVATLSALALSSGTLSPTFASGTTSYTASVANSVATGYTVTPTKTNSNASTVQYLGASGTTAFNGALAVGENVIRTVVTAQDGITTSTYTVTVTRAASNVATLSALALLSGTLSPVFATGTTSYTASVANSVATGYTVTPTKTDSNASTVQYLGASGTTPFTGALAVGSNVIRTVVTAQDGITTSTYTVTVTRLSNVATLSGASIKAQASTLGTPNAALASATPGAVTLTTAQATGVAATTFTQTDSNAAVSRIVKYASGAATTGFDTDAIFSNGATTTVSNSDFFIVKVTAQDGTVNYYRFNVTVNSNVATLSGASIKAQTVTLGTPNAALASVAAGSVTLTTAQATGVAATTFTKTDALATAKIAKYLSGSTADTASFDTALDLTSGTTVTVANGDFFIVKVSAQDGTVNYYRFNVTVNSNVATLSGASIKGLSATMGTAGSTLGSLSAGTITLTLAQATGTAITTFTKSDTGAGFGKIVKLAAATTETQANFDAAATFTNGSDATVSNGDYFIIMVTAADGTVNYSRFNVVFAINPTVPLNLSATPQAGGAVISWSAPISNGGSTLTGYVVEASTDSTTWNSAGTTNQSTTQLSVTNLANGTAYVYRVRASNSSGDLNYNWATSESVTSFYYVTCSIEGSFYVSSANAVPQIPSAAGVNCKGEVTIPQGILQININAFASNPDTVNRNVTKVNLPVGLKTIDQGALKNLGLTSVIIPETVQVVGIYSFMNNYITSVEVKGTGPCCHPTALLDSAFRGNPSFTLTLGSGKIEIGELFGTATLFTSVDWGSGLKSIGRRAFYNVSASSWAPLFPATITSIDTDAFFGTGIKTIRFGTATSHSVTSIAQSAFDPSITSVQYCGTTGTVISNYINSRFTTKTIWCSEEVPNAPINLTAVAGSSGQIVLNWGKGATRALIEAPTDVFEIRYSSDGGSTWSAIIQAAGTATSITVPNLTNGTSYVFQIRAKNLFGNSTYSANASGTPLGTQINPTFGPSTSTADGFTVNVTNYDSTFTYGVPQFTDGSGTITVGTASGSNLPITVSGLAPSGLATISIGNSKPGVTPGSNIASGSALNAAKVPAIGSIGALTGGFTAVVTNYDSAYQWNVSASVGNASINPQGGITVSGVAPSTPVELTVSTTRTGYAPGSTKVTVTTLALLRVSYNGTRATGGATPTDANSYASKATATVLANPASGGLTLNGYDFAGWSLNSDESGQIYQSGSTLALDLVNVTLYAKWTLHPYTVTYFSNGSTSGSVPVDSNTYTMGSSVPIAGNTGTLVRTGYSFIGWGISSTDTVNLYISGNTFTVGTNNIAFWARWSPNTYRVTFDANGGSGAPSKAYDDYTTAGNAITLATVGTMQKTGYNFTGWGLSAVSTPVANQFTTTASIELYAQWTIANYAVTYLAGTNGSGTVPTQANVNYGSNFTVAPSTGLTGSDGTNPYAFVSWSDGTKTYAPGQSILMGAGAVTLTAQWTRIYNVTYSFNGGSVGTPIADQQKIAGDTIVISSTVPTRAGYDFVTWKDQSGEEATAGANYVVRDGHYLIYAQWIAKSYTVTYDVNGGNTSPTQANRTIGQIFTVAAAPTKIGHDFEHWSDGTKNYNAGSDYQVGISNVVLQAIWTPQLYQISYNFNGGTGTPIAAQNYTFGTGPATLPASGPSRQEFSFRGWSNSPTATTGVFTYEPSASILLHAVWVTSVYRLTFNAGSGVSDTATATVTIGQSMTLPSATRANYTLQGWSTSPTGGTLLLTTSPYTPTTDATLYAQWAPQIFIVTYNGNGGTAGKVSDSAVYNSQTTFPLPTATRTSYVFNGWYSQASGGYLLGNAGTNYSPTGSVTAYAQWIQGSLSGMGAATLIAQITVRDGINSGFTAGSNGSTATVTYTAGALPDGTVITAYLENSMARVTSLLLTPASPVLSLIIAWVAPDGTVPETAAGKPIVMTVTNSSITAGSKIYGLVGNQPDLLGIALVDGQVQVSITKDPAVVVAKVAPDAPTGVTATAINESSATISWTASANNGGSAIIKYVATTGAGKSCESATTSCVITGLAAGTPYTFTVLANNAIGNSASSSPSAQLSLTAPPSGGGGGGGGGGAAPATPVITTPVITTPVIDAKAAAEKAAADAKAAAELKAVQDKAAAEASSAAALKAAQELADVQAKAAAELKAAQDKAAEELRIATELKAAQDKADAELKAAAEKKALEDAAAAAALAAKKIVPVITLYSISSKLTLSAYDNAYLKKYISTLKTKAPVTCIGYYYSKNTTIAKAKALATTQAKSVCAMIKKAKPSVITSIALYPSTKAPLAAKGAKWVAVSYRVDSFKK